MKRRLSRDQKKELADQARLLRAWKQWHAEQLDDALAGTHGATIVELLALLDQLELSSAAVLLDFMRPSDCDYDTRLTVLHQINQTITRLRERNGMAAIDDPLPGQPDNVYRRIKQNVRRAARGEYRPGSDETMKRRTGEI
jgi:hypothetical protein